MRFGLEQAIEVLEATPGTLRSLLGGLSGEWTGETTPSAEAAAPPPKTGGGPDIAMQPVEQDKLKAEWRAFDVVGHLMHGEQTDWIPRARMIIRQSGERTFVPFDRFAQSELSSGKLRGALLDEFAAKRAENLETLRVWKLTEAQLDLPGMHPELDDVTLRQLLATWVVHDLNHIRQMVTEMAARYREDVGPWREYLSI